MTRASRSSRYGALAEEKARARYGLEADRSSWHDARADDGTPIEVKAAMLNRSSGKEGRFRLFEDYHKRLEQADGAYVFVAYRAVGRGISVEAMRSIAASSIRVEWYGAGGHRESRQAKVPPREIFTS